MNCLRYIFFEVDSSNILDNYEYVVFFTISLDKDIWQVIGA